MWTYLAFNLGKIAVGVILALIILLVVLKMIRDKKNNKSGCGCGCENCPSANNCKEFKK